jgi:hypothetical protein
MKQLHILKTKTDFFKVPWHIRNDLMIVKTNEASVMLYHKDNNLSTVKNEKVKSAFQLKLMG